MAGRIRDIVLKPQRTWQEIEGEPATRIGLLTRWIMPLAAIGPVASLIGGQLFGHGNIVRTRPSLGYAVGDAITQYAAAIAAALACAAIIDALMISFGGQKDKVRSLKTVAYGGTAAYIACIFFLVPPLSVLALLGLYSAYLYWLGLRIVMHVPKRRALACLAVTIVSMLVVLMLLGWIRDLTMSALYPGPYASVV